MPEKKTNKNFMICCGILVIYAILTFIGAVNHEIWYDEAQAWNIARDNDIKGIFHQLAYEGHPPLWYMILYIPSHLGLTCNVMPLISWFITVVAAALIMFKAPFNNIVKAAVLFSGGFLFLNSVMSRVYCLINLIAVLIAIVYPNRKKYPILYGFLIALLANTHVCMSGFIGIIGIFMIIDLFKDIKNKSKKQIIKEVTGLIIAGIGVLLLVIPLLNSLSLNSSTKDDNITLQVFLSSFVDVFINISNTAISYTDINLAGYILSGVVGLLLAFEILIMKNKTRPFFMMLFFWLFFTIATEVVWLLIPNRAVVFLYMYFIIAWIAEYEPQNNAVKIWSGSVYKKDINKYIKKIIMTAEKIDRNFQKIYITVLTAILLLAVPSGAIYLFSDYTKEFCPAKKAAEYIRDNFSEDSVFVPLGIECTDIAAYLPEYKFYSIKYEKFCTYELHEKNTFGEFTPKAYEDLSQYEHIYGLYICSDPDYISYNKNVIYTIREGMQYGMNTRYIEISELDINDIYPMEE